MYPINLRLRGRPCVVIGGGSVAARKVLSLLECAAEISVVSPQLCAQLKEMVNKRRVRFKCKYFEKADIEGALLAVAATDSSKVNREISRACNERKVLVNVADDPENSDFFVPSFFRRGSLTFAIGTAGKSPGLAARIRREVEALYGPEYGVIADILGEIREELLESGIPAEQRQKRLLDLADKELTDIIDAIKGGVRGE